MTCRDLEKGRSHRGENLQEFTRTLPRAHTGGPRRLLSPQESSGAPSAAWGLKDARIASHARPRPAACATLIPKGPCAGIVGPFLEDAVPGMGTEAGPARQHRERRGFGLAQRLSCCSWGLVRTVWSLWSDPRESRRRWFQMLAVLPLRRKRLGANPSSCGSELGRGYRKSGSERKGFGRAGHASQSKDSRDFCKEQTQA